MEIPSYVFISPYPSSFQVGRPDPSAQVSEERQDAVEAFSKAGNESSRDANEYLSSVKSSAASVNVALVNTNTQTSDSLTQFTSLNSIAQANLAFNT